MNTALIESETRAPGVPLSSFDRTQVAVDAVMQMPAAAVVIVTITRGDSYRHAALRQLMCLAYSQGAMDALKGAVQS